MSILKSPGISVIVQHQCVCYPPMTWWEKRKHGWSLVKDNVAARGQNQIHRVFYNTFVNIRYMLGFYNDVY